MRIDQLTFTRFLAAFAIVIFHYATKIAPFNEEAVSFIFTKAHLGVSYFFVLSGFVMIIAYGNKDKIGFFDFIKNRLARVYPLYILALGIMLGYFIYNKMIIHFGDFILQAFCLQSWIPGKALIINGPGWSIPVEFLFYFSFPLLFNYLYKKKNITSLICPILFFWFISQTVLHFLRHSSFYQGFPSESHDFIFYFPLMHLNQFLIGNLAGLMFLKYKPQNRNLDIPIILVFAIILLTIKFTPYQVNLHNGMLALLFAVIIYLFSSNSGYITKIFNFKIFVFLGEISYGVYILQKPVYVWVHIYFKKAEINDISVQFYIYTIVLLVVSTLVYFSFEKPLRRIIKKMKTPKIPFKIVKTN